MADCKICGKPTNSHPWYCDECMVNYPSDKMRYIIEKEISNGSDIDKAVEVAKDQLGDKMPNYFGVSSVSTASGLELKYVVLQVTLKEKFLGTGSGNLTELEKVINIQASKGYRLHTITTSSANSTGVMGGDRIQATMVFEKID